MSQLHNITHLLGYVHRPNSRFENKDSGCWNPSASIWIRSQDCWIQLISWVMLCQHFPTSAENNTRFKKLIPRQLVHSKWLKCVMKLNQLNLPNIEWKQKTELPLSTYSGNSISWDRHWERQFSNAGVQSHVLQLYSLEHSNLYFCKPLIFMCFLHESSIFTLSHWIVVVEVVVENSLKLGWSSIE